MKEFLGIGGYTREPEGYLSPEHLIFTISLVLFTLALAIVLGIRNKNANDKKKNIPLICAALLMDAVEIFEPNVRNHKLAEKYDNVFVGDIKDYKYDWYDLIIFGDVIEHMTVEDAQQVLRYAWTRCRDMIVAVPWLYKQDAIYGNKWEIHIQDDLTPALFEERYPGFEILVNTNMNYAYYHKGAQTPL